MKKTKKFLKITICIYLVSFILCFPVLAVEAPEPENSEYTGYEESIMFGASAVGGTAFPDKYAMSFYDDEYVGPVYFKDCYLAIYNASEGAYLDTDAYWLEDLGTVGHEFEKPYRVFQLQFNLSYSYVPKVDDRLIVRLTFKVPSTYNLAANQMVHTRLSIMFDNSYWTKSVDENYVGWSVGELNDTWYYCNSYYWMERFPYRSGIRWYHRYTYDFLPQNPGMNYSEYSISVPIQCKSDLSKYPYFTFVAYDPQVTVGTEQDFKTYASPDTSASDNYNKVESEILGSTEAGQAAAGNVLGSTDSLLKNMSQSLSAVKIIFGDMLGELPQFNDLINISLSLGFFAFLLGASVSLAKGGNMAAEKVKEKNNERLVNRSQTDRDMRKLGM